MNCPGFQMVNELDILRDVSLRLETAGMLTEFTRRNRVALADFETWMVSKEDLILSKLASSGRKNWAHRTALSPREFLEQVRNKPCSHLNCNEDTEYWSAIEQRISEMDAGKKYSAADLERIRSKLTAEGR